MKFPKKVDIDVSKDLYNPIQVKQSDNARYLLFRILDNGVPFDLSNKTVRVYGLKPDGTKVFNNLTIINAARGLAELQLTTQMLVKPGCLKLELVIYEATDILSTTKFDIDIISCIRDDGAIESTNEFSALTVALAKADEYGEALKQGTENIELIYATELNGVKSSLEESKVEVNPVYANIRERGLHIPVVSFGDDDAAKEVYSRLYPIFKAKNVPFASAIITGLIGTNHLYMTLEQLKEVHNSGLCETLSHTVDVESSLTDIPESDLDRQIENSKKWLKDNGFDYRGFVYPQSNYNVNIKKKVSNNYDFAFGYMGVNPNGYLDHYVINRIAFGSYTEGNPTVNGNSEKNTLEYYKACVDYCYENKTWLTFMTHISPQPVEQDIILGQLIDYIKSKGIPILKPSDAFKLKANKLAVGLKEESHIWIGEDGRYDINISDYQFIRLPNDSVTRTTNYDTFANGKISYCLINRNVVGFPEGKPGVLIVDKIIKDREYCRLIYKIYRNGGTYECTVNADGSYSDWVCTSNIVTSQKARVNVPLITIPSNSVVDTNVELVGIKRATGFVNAVPAYGLGSGIMYNVFSLNDNQFTIRVQNISSSEKTISAREWIVNYIV